jgi:hypothetical protein
VQVLPPERALQDADCQTCPSTVHGGYLGDECHVGLTVEKPKCSFCVKYGKECEVCSISLSLSVCVWEEVMVDGSMIRTRCFGFRRFDVGVAGPRR